MAATKDSQDSHDAARKRALLTGQTPPSGTLVSFYNNVPEDEVKERLDALTAEHDQMRVKAEAARKALRKRRSGRAVAEAEGPPKAEG